MAEIIEYRVEGLEALLKKVDGNTLLAQPIRDFFKSSISEMKQHITDFTPVDRGPLRASILPSYDSSLIMQWGMLSTGIKYAPHIEFGTKAHLILPRNRRVLAWQGGGKLGRGTRRRGRTQMIGGGEMMFATHVHHPGTKGAFMFKKGLDASKDAIRRFLQEAGKDIEAIWGGK